MHIYFKDTGQPTADWYGLLTPGDAKTTGKGTMEGSSCNRFYVQCLRIETGWLLNIAVKLGLAYKGHENSHAMSYISCDTQFIIISLGSLDSNMPGLTWRVCTSPCNIFNI